MLVIFYLFLYSFYHHFNIILQGKWRSLLISNYKSTIRSKLSLIDDTSKIKPNEKQIIKFVEQEVPSLTHLTVIYYYLFINNWLPATGIYNFIIILY